MINTFSFMLEEKLLDFSKRKIIIFRIAAVNAALNFPSSPRCVLALCPSLVYPSRRMARNSLACSLLMDNIQEERRSMGCRRLHGKYTHTATWVGDIQFICGAYIFQERQLHSLTHTQGERERDRDESVSTSAKCLGGCVLCANSSSGSQRP